MLSPPGRIWWLHFPRYSIIHMCYVWKLKCWSNLRPAVNSCPSCSNFSVSVFIFSKYSLCLQCSNGPICPSCFKNTFDPHQTEPQNKTTVTINKLIFFVSHTKSSTFTQKISKNQKKSTCVFNPLLRTFKSSFSRLGMGGGFGIRSPLSLATISVPGHTNWGQAWQV